MRRLALQAAIFVASLHTIPAAAANMRSMSRPVGEEVRKSGSPYIPLPQLLHDFAIPLVDNDLSRKKWS